jgi:hypothetical protein
MRDETARKIEEQYWDDVEKAQLVEDYCECDADYTVCEHCCMPNHCIGCQNERR